MSEENDLRLAMAILRTRFDNLEARMKDDGDFIDKKIDDHFDELSLKIRTDRGHYNQRFTNLENMLAKRIEDGEARSEKRFTAVETTITTKLAISDFQPIKNIVYGLVAIILTVFATAVAKFFIIPDGAVKP